MTDLARYYDESIPPSLLVPPVTPAITLLAPSSIVVDTPTTVTITGTDFREDTQVWVDGVRQSTTHISATSLSYTALADQVGSQDVRVVTRGLVSNGLTLTVTATSGDVFELPGDVDHFTIPAIEQWVDEHPDFADEVLAAEQARGDHARVTLVDWLDGFISDRDAGVIVTPDEEAEEAEEAEEPEEPTS